MSQKCKLSGKAPSYGNNVPFSQKKTRRRWNINLQSKRIYVPELGRFVRLRVSTAAMRTVDKIGLMAYVRKQGLRIEDVAE
ncbi:MAG TPA: 50S ribosomal protein L28 [Anaerolineales bacterium]|nr:50S ribosomal protein L28 [Anaerolineales bacterium]